MRFTPMIKAALATAAVGAVLGVGGFAIAAFVQESTTDPVAGSAESFSAVTVTGAQTGTLLPGESAHVTLTLTNPNANVKAKLISVTPGEVVVDTVVDSADKVYCHGQIELSTLGADSIFPTLAVSEANFPFKLTDAVKLKPDTDIRCQNMTFHTTWTTKFEAVR
ncbi:hypothetical protein E1193_06465 [Micromonospora sp. KC606]|uniref:hypothetical protein n=1 Tax=Micromonospora sp. KC606 TaxID=2530379 RepID=UPI001053926B|nr:hypothetical protein [Micromonospora sp. KC606]TDC84213.1 hypothetical protein E1193_06465 [Micromonospora sp. KC606]